MQLRGRFLGALSRGDAPALHLFERNDGGLDAWERVKSLRVPPPEEPGASYSPESFALGGDVLAIGAPDFSIIAVNGGAVFIHERNADGADTWNEVLRIWPDDVTSGSRFGTSVALSGDTIRGVNLAVGAPGDGRGAVYIHQRFPLPGGVGEAWGMITKLRPPDGMLVNNFGAHVRIESSTVVATAREGDPSNGMVHLVFERSKDGPDHWGFVESFRVPVNAGIYGGLAFQGRTVVAGLPVNNLGSVDVWECRPRTLSNFDFESVAFGSDGMKLEWTGFEGVFHTLERNATLRGEDWSDVPGFSRVPGVESLMRFVDRDAAVPGQTFYRLIREIPPFMPEP